MCTHHNLLLCHVANGFEFCFQPRSYKQHPGLATSTCALCILSTEGKRPSLQVSVNERD